MQCNQLDRLIRDWYVHVKNETMAPGRMMQFVDQHIKECDACRQDQELEQEIEKIREFILPESKLPKSFRAPDKTLTPEISQEVEKKNLPDDHEDDDKQGDQGDHPESETPDKNEK